VGNRNAGTVICDEQRPVHVPHLEDFSHRRALRLKRLAGVSPGLVSTGAPAGWPTNSSSTLVFALASGSEAHAPFRGCVYLPDASVQLFATNTSQAEVLDGDQGWDVSLPASANGVAAQTETSPTRRTVTSRRRSPLPPSRPPALCRRNRNDNSKTVTVDSWWVNNP
jgi:hypothetical protein